jgi:glycosyltransferase involved in cell wall biosynthesis
VRSAVAGASLEGAISFRGEVGGEEKRKLWEQADVFVLPTHSENFGIVVAESLANGVPVITTRAAPWAELEEYRCGWWIEQGPEALRAALAFAMSLPDAERHAMGERGRRLVEKRFAWARVAQETSDFYNWLLGRGDKPGCVLADA